MWPCRVKVKGVIFCWANLDAFGANICHSSDKARPRHANPGVLCAGEHPADHRWIKRELISAALWSTKEKH
jgi:hypothetical protein